MTVRPAWTVRTTAGRRAAALVVAALVVGGCSPQGGTAAVVEGRTIPVADLHAATEELRPYLQDPSPAAILVILVAEPTFARVAAENGVAVSSQQARDLLGGLAEDAEQPAAGVTDQFSEAAVTVARFTLLQQALGQLPDAERVFAGLSEDLVDLDVEVNPRYGEVDFATGGITPVERPWLVPDQA